MPLLIYDLLMFNSFFDFTIFIWDILYYLKFIEVFTDFVIKVTILDCDWALAEALEQQVTSA